MNFVIIAVVWIVCGILSQGMCQYHFAQTLKTNGKLGKDLWFLLLLSGTSSLCAMVVICFAEKTWGLKFRDNKKEA